MFEYLDKVEGHFPIKNAIQYYIDVNIFFISMIGFLPYTHNFLFRIILGVLLIQIIISISRGKLKNILFQSLAFALGVFMYFTPYFLLVILLIIFLVIIFIDMKTFKTFQAKKVFGFF